jgi:xanthine dehydrogenase YagR molybdenum-binding subunit
MTGGAVIEAARDLKKQIAEKGLPKDGEFHMVHASPSPRMPEGKQRAAFAAQFCEVEVNVETGHIKVTKFVAVHDCGRIMNPLTAIGQIKGAVQMGIGMALHEDLLYDKRSGFALTGGYYYDRVSTHRDAVDVEVVFIETDDGFGPYGAKSIGESGKVPAVAAVGNAIANALGRRLRDLPITRDKVLEVRA